VVNKVEQFENFSKRASSWLNWITISAFVLMAIVTTIDVLGAKLFQKPFLIAFDLVSLLGLLAVAPAIAWIQTLRGHIEVELVVSHLKPRAQLIIQKVITLMGILLFIVMTWQMIDYALTVQQTNRVTGMAEIPFYPFAYFTALCFLMVVVVLTAQFLKLITTEATK
jgi:TRAP-type C4-dicarboxylate transport system permease small subunit